MTSLKEIRSIHFTLEEIGHGIFAAIHQAGGAAIANAGIIDLGDATLIFDTFISPAAAKDLRLAAEALSGRPVTYVFNSHYHNDHIRGNQEFPDAQIISTAETLRLIQTAGLEELAWDQDNAPKRYQHFQNIYENTLNQNDRESIRFVLDYYRVLSESLEGLKMIEPQHTFQDRLSLSGSSRTVELITYGGGHTGDDGFLFIPDAGVLFLADLLFVGCHPYLADGNPDNLISILKQVGQLDANLLVPGHGPVSTQKDLALMIDYVQVVADLAKQHADIEIITPPPPFDTWELDTFFQSNLDFLSRWQPKTS